jgi:glycogen(starch) synthase
MLLGIERRQRRILMTADAVGGIWSYALDLIRELAPYGVEVLLAVMGQAPDHSQQQEAARIRNLNLVAKSFPLEWYGSVSGKDIESSGAWLRLLASDFRPDIIHVNGYAPAAGEWNVPTVVVAHSCVYSWWSSVHGEMPPSEWIPYRNRVIAGLESASAVIAPTQWMLRTLQSEYGVTLRKPKVIRNFSTLSVLPAPKEPFVFSCGRLWDESKNMLLLEQIASSIDWPLHVAGSLAGPQGASEKFSEPRQSGSGTRELSQPGTGANRSGALLDGLLSRSEVSRRLARAGIFAHPAKYEPFGLAVLEAAQNGCALVLAEIPPLRELWNGCALFASPDDAKQWTECLNRLARDSSLRQDLASKALKRSGQYGAVSAAAQYIEVYDGLTRQSKAAYSPSQINEASHQTLLPLHRF